MTNLIDRSERFAHLLALELEGTIATYGFAATKIAADLNVNYTTLYRYFKGERPMPADTFGAACEFIGADPADLVERAHKRLVAELGEYGAEQDAEIINPFTPANGIPLGSAALDPGYDPRLEEDQ